MSPNLNLEISSSQNQDFAISRKSAHITGSIHLSLPSTIIRVFQKFFNSQFGSVEIPSGHALTCNEQFSCLSITDMLKVFIKDINPGIMNRFTNGNYFLLWSNLFYGRIDSGLRGTIDIP